MSKTKRGQDTSPTLPQMSFYIDRKNLVTEFIPTYPKRYEYWFRFNLRKLQNKLNIPHYYWQYRHLLSPEQKKITDLQFLIHVYEDHECVPEDKWEKQHFNNAYILYGAEFRNLIMPKIEEEKENKAVIHPYAQAYYKRWLKKSNPQMKQFYHGVESYETIELLEIIQKLEDSSSKRYKWRKKYHDQKVKNSRK